MNSYPRSLGILCLIFSQWKQAQLPLLQSKFLVLKDSTERSLQEKLSAESAETTYFISSIWNKL